MRKIRQSEFFLSEKKQIKLEKKHVQERRVKLSKKRKNAIEKRAIGNNYTKIFRLFSKNKKESTFNKYQRKSTEKLIKLPKIFSVISAPEDFLTLLDKFGFGDDSSKLQKITIDHSEVTKLDLAAESILDFLIIGLKIIKKNRLTIQGFLPNDPSAERYVRATGIIKNLEIKSKFLDGEQEKLLRVFTMRSKGLVSILSYNSKGWKESAIEDFVEHINLCLKDNGKRLTKETQGELAKYTGEILNNAEDHSGYDEVVITGYLDNSDNMHMCEIAIFNFGKTIADTFKEMPEMSYTHKEIDAYIKEHLKRSWFGESWTKDNLLTLVALQGHISSKNLRRDQDRGQGTVDLIDFFQQVHKQCVKTDESKAEMAVLSGSTYIYFDGTYAMDRNENGRKVIAFNKNNNLHEKPDSKYVRNLQKLSFPGTIISIKFPMKSENTEPTDIS